MTETAKTRYKALGLWMVWTVGTAFGWLVGRITGGALAFSSGVWDPDEVESYMSAAPIDRLIAVLVMGAMLGLVIGVIVGLVQWLALHRSPRRAALTAVAVTFGTALFCSLTSIGPSELVGETVIALKSGAVGGLIAGWLAGMSQWLAMRPRLGKTSGWVTWTTVAWMAAWSLIWAWGTTSSSALIPALVGGTLVGLAQWPVLRRNVARAWWWIPASAASWAFAFLPFTEAGDWEFARGAVVGLAMASLIVLLLSLSPGSDDEPSGIAQRV